MIISITGGTGFIGRRLVLHHLAHGHTVRVLSRRVRSDAALPDSVVWYQGDLLMSDELVSFAENADVLYHCAGEIRDESRMRAVHVNGTSKLVDAATGRIGRWVQLSSVGVYGAVHDGVVSEASPVCPLGSYEVTKTQADALVLEAAEQDAFDAVLLRPSNVYGVGMRNRSLCQLIAMIERGWFFFIGPAGASANYVHVDDVVDALMLCATHPNAVNKVFNLSGWDTMETFVACVAETLGRPAPTLRLPVAPIRMLATALGKLPGFPLTVSRVDALCKRSRYPIDLIEQELGFVIRVSLREGLEELVKKWRTAA